MTTVREILTQLERHMPPELRESWDNIGLLVGRAGQQVERVICALDVTLPVVEEARESGAQLIVAHHPVIFTSVSRVTDETPTGRVVRRLIECDISAICMHTNLDSAQQGVNDQLAARLGLEEVENLGGGESGQLGRVGQLPQQLALGEFVAHVREKLAAHGVRYVDSGRPVRRVAVGGGACGKMMDLALEKGADTFVIGDCSYDIMCAARDKGLNLLDAGHFPTENVVVPALARLIAGQCPGVAAQPSRVHADCIQFG